MKRKQKRKNVHLLILISILLITSLLDMYGASFMSDLYRGNMIKQAMWIATGFVVMFIIYKIDIDKLFNISIPLYAIGIISLFLVLFIGHNVNGANSWFKFGPVSFQPSEIFKFSYILFMANLIGRSKRESKWTLLRLIIFTFIPALLIFLEPDTGVVLMYLLMMMGIMQESINKKYIIACLFIALFLIGTFLSLYFFKGDLFIRIFGTGFFYRIDRLLSFVNASSYQLKNALIGVGASGLFGLGLLSPKIYIPEAITDFVFDLTITNFGAIMGIIVVIIYVSILYMIYREYKSTRDAKNRVILSGIFYMMLFQVFEHIMMNLGLMPITGITLPFLSYGGSSLISYFMLFGLILKIMKINKETI